ncbi:DUF3987 domain-containing protein [Streptomyces sp. NBC_00197]|uniref:DUF3987 domain-containing protein n=1 Tax=Streptomyces sp. NBC_00197 TaxID=2975676 RepID=UPI0032494414
MAFKPTKDRPVLSRKAWHGIAGDILDLVSPHTEADPAGILSTTLATFSCMVGTGRKVTGPITQPVNVWFILMGETGIGRKGTADNVVASFMADVDEWFWSNCRTPSLSTGEGLTYSVRDVKIIDHIDGMGVGDNHEMEEGLPNVESIKNMLVTSTEFAAVMSKSQGGTLGPVLRDAWDGKDLAIHTKDAYHSTNPHITVLGHVTPTEFGAKLKSHDMAGGTYNRFLPMFVEMPHELPWPERPSDYEDRLSEITDRLRMALPFAQEEGVVTFTEDAKQFYISEIYPEYNDTQGDSETMKQFTTRRLPYVMRIAAVYALMNEREHVYKEDLEAAKAVVDYSIESARYIEKNITTVSGPSRAKVTLEEDADLLKRALEQAGEEGLTRTHLTQKVFSYRRHRHEVNALITKVGAKVRKTPVPSGRPREVVYLPELVSQGE